MNSPQQTAEELAEKLMFKLSNVEYPSNTYWCNEVKRLILTELNLAELLKDKERLDWLENDENWNLISCGHVDKPLRQAINAAMNQPQ